MEFKYVAVNEHGKRITGICEAQNKQGLALQLAEVKLQLVSSRVMWFSIMKARKTKLTSTFVLEFSRQMSVLLASGLSITQAFEIVKGEQKSRVYQDCIERMLERVKQGKPVSSSLKQASEAFDDNYLEVISVGEQTGALALSFEQNHYYLSAAAKLKGQIKQACVYPILVLLVSVMVVSILLVKVIPGFESLFASFSQPLPYATLQVIALSDLLQKQWMNILIIFVATLSAFLISLKVAKFRLLVDKYTMKIPLVGQLLRFNLYASFALNCHNMTKAGLPLHQALEKLKTGTKNLFFSAKLSDIQQNILAGNSFHQSCFETQLFPSLFIQLIKVGEETGTLDERLKNLADVYRDRLDSSVKAMVGLIEPAIMIFMGVMIGGLVLVMYLPIFEMSTFL